MDIAHLGLMVDSRPVADASKDLDRIREAAARAEKQADSFGKRVEDAGKRAAAANDNASRAADRAAKAYDGYSRAAQMAARAMGAIVGAAIGKALIDFADTWSDINARIGLAIRNMDASGAVLDRLATVARRTYSALDLTAESFVRNASVLRELGKSTVEQLDYTEALNLALVVSGARGEHAARVQDALGKAMAAGKLRGDELNTVIERGGRVAEILAEELGVSQNQLRKLGSEGKITGDTIYNSLTKRLEQLQEEAESMPATIGDGLMLIRNALFQTIGVFDQANGLSATFAGILIAIADNIQRVVTYGAAAVTMYGTYYVAAFVAARVATLDLATAAKTLRAALLRTGIGALVVLAGELAYQFTRLVEASGGFSGAFSEMGNRAILVMDAIKFGFFALTEGLRSAWYGAMADILRSTEETFGPILRAFGVTADAMSEAIDNAGRKAEQWGEVAKSSAIIASEQFKRAFASLETPSGEIPNTPGVRSPTTPDIDKAAEKAKKAYDKIVLGAKEFIAAQELERQALGMTEQEANRLRYTQDLLNQAKQAGITLTAAQTAELTGLASQMAAAEQATKAAKATQDAYNEAAGSMGGIFKGLMDRTKDWRQSLLDLIPVVLKLINSMNVAQGGKGIFGGGVFQSFLGGLLGIGFAGGGYTGPGAASQPAGIVHAGEYVFSKAATDKIGLGYLDSLHSAAKGYMNGGYVRSHAPANVNMRGYQSGGYVRPHSGGQEVIKIELVSRFDADGGFESAVERSSRPVAMQESAKAAGQVARAVPSMALGAMDDSRTRRRRTISPGGSI